MGTWMGQIYTVGAHWTCHEDETKSRIFTFVKRQLGSMCPHHIPTVGMQRDKSDQRRGNTDAYVFERD
jgi:hypothetical protein